MNSVSEAMVSGVPMVVIPFVSDQPVNARQVQRLGLGQVLDYTSITPESLCNTAFAVMNDPQIRQNVRTMQDEIAHATGNEGAVEIIENFCSSQ